jgi:Protein of unknown function
MRDAHWLCLDCSKDTSDEYYGVHNYIWRRAVDRSQRHGMLCLSCLERRLGRFLRPEDFKSVPVNGPIAQFLAQRSSSDNVISPVDKEGQIAEFDDSPMGWDDYGLIDELTADTLREIDAALMSQAAIKPRKVAGVIGRTLGSSAHVPGLPDYFYLERIRLLVERGALKFVGDVDELMKGEVHLP